MKTQLSPNRVADMFLDEKDLEPVHRDSKRARLIVPLDWNSLDIDDDLIEQPDFKPCNLFNDFDGEKLFSSASIRLKIAKLSPASLQRPKLTAEVKKRTSAAAERLKLSKSDSNSWTDIFGTGKLLVSLSQSALDIELRWMNSEFYDTFCHDHERPTSLRALFGKATNAKTVQSLHTSFLAGTDIDEYINLYRFNGIPLSCHLTLKYLSKFNSTGKSDKLAIMTIVSASAVGNELYCGIGAGKLSQVSISTRLAAISTGEDSIDCSDWVAL
jgi:hypothetical protein